MENTAFENEVCNIGNIERVWRLVAGSLLIAITFFSSSDLGLAALLPIIAVYPLMTAVLGWDPFYLWSGANPSFKGPTNQKFEKSQWHGRKNSGRRPFTPIKHAIS